MGYVIGLAVGLAVLGAVLTVLRKQKATAPSAGNSDEAMPFKRNKYFLSLAEQSFYNALKQAVASGRCSPRCIWWMCCGYHLRPRTSSGIATGSRPSTWTSCCASPRGSGRCWRLSWTTPLIPDATGSSGDALVDKVLADAGLPMLRVPARPTYDPASLADSIKQALGAAQAVSAAK